MTLLGRRPDISATRGRPSPVCGTAPLPVRAVHLTPPPEEGTRDCGDLGGSRASSGESLGGAENRLPTGFGREPGQVGAVGWEAGAPGLILGAGKQGRPAGRKAVAGLRTPGVGGYDAWVEVLNSSSVWRRRVALWFPEQGRALKSQVKETPRWV